MWYSAVNLGYANPTVTAALQAQIKRLPQLACQYLHREKIELAQMICESVERAFGMKGRVHFNVGGSQAIEDALKLVRKNTGRQHMLAFQGGYHGRTLAASAITSSYRYREAFGEFADRAEFLPYPVHLPFAISGRRAKDRGLTASREFERLFEHEYTGAWNPKTGHSEFGALFIEAVQGTGGYIIPPRNYFKTNGGDLPEPRHTRRGRRDPDGLLPHRQDVGDRALRHPAGHHRFRQGAHQWHESDFWPLGA